MANEWADFLRASLSDASGWAVTALRIVVIVAVAWIGTSVLQGLIRRFRERILDEFELAGVERWDESAVVLRGRFRVAPLAQWDVRREYLRRLKAAFDQHGIEIPFPQLALHAPPGLLASSRSLATPERTTA